MQIKHILSDQHLKELTQHRTVELPIACYETEIKQNLYGYIPLHWHEEIQCVLIVKGEAIFQIKEEKVVIREGDGVFINSGCLHMVEEKGNLGCVYICLNVSPYFVLSQELYTSHVIPYIQATNLPYVFVDGSELWGKNILDAIVKTKQLIEQKPQYFELDITMQLTQIWKNLIMNGFRLEYDQAEIVKSQRMKEMLNWVHIHYPEKIMLEDIAKAGNLSRSECCRYFKRVLKTTPLNYVMNYRIQKSLSLLQEVDSNVTEVAYQVGFNSTSYFIEKFRKTMNMTPLAYKNSRIDD